MSIGKALGLVGIVLSVAMMVVCGGGSGGGDGGNSKAEGGSSNAASSGKGGSFTDSRNKQKYRTVKIGGTTWMAENLNIKIGNSWCYYMEESNCEKYGRLYGWETAKRACPNGWHLPSRSEWDELVHAAEGNVAGKKLKSKGGWSGTDDYGFSALPGGYRDYDGSFNYVGKLGNWWSATEAEVSGGYAYYRYMSIGYDRVYEGYYGKEGGYSVRCAQ